MKYDLSRYWVYHANGRWPEEDFLDTFGDMEVRDFIVKHMYSIFFPGVDDLDKFREYLGNKTVRSYYQEMFSNPKPGWIENHFLSGRDDAERIVLIRKHDTFEVTTKPSGESRCWLEIGTEQALTSKSGNSYMKWMRHEYRYPL